MNEIQMTNLMNARFGAVHASDAARARALGIPHARTTVRSHPWVYATGTAALAVLAGTFLLTPRTSHASAAANLKRVQEAISNVRTMKAVNSHKIDGKFIKNGEEFYEDRQWLYHGLQKDFWTLETGNRIYQWKGGSNDATVDNLQGLIVSEGHGISALDYVLGDFKTGTPFSTEQKPHKDVKGKPTYLLHVEVKFDDAPAQIWKKSCDIVVDKQSDLPISVEYYDKDEAREQTRRIDFEFNKNFPPHQFEPVFGHAGNIRDLANVRSETLAKWSAPIATVTSGSDSNEVRELDVNPDGTILMMYTGAPYGSVDTEPEGTEQFVPASISDSNGTVYLRTRDQLFAGWLEKNLKMKGHYMGVISWIPLEPKETSNDLSVKVGFAKRIFSQTAPDTSKDGEETKSLDLVAKRISSKYPDWADAIPIINHYDDPAPAVMRGDYYKAHGNVAKAAQWYEQSYKDAKDFFVNTAYKKLLPAIDCLQQLGDTKKAIRLKRTMLQGESKDMHLTSSQRAAAKKELERLH